MFKGGYMILDGAGLNLLTGSTPVTISGIWDRAVECLKIDKPLMVYNLKYGTAPMSPVAAFGWYISETEIVLVSATIHVHIKNDNTVTTLDVVS